MVGRRRGAKFRFIKQVIKDVHTFKNIIRKVVWPQVF